ncbi:hypothetical protein [Halomonas korlensis]|uniref:hypothetical protein n=1 Tax=Halomonas korlensis TaxID=463301 RepID=UPI001C31699D|nr:hypothetical protein [Halomonas korlensis]
MMIGAGIFALTGQMAEMTIELFPLKTKDYSLAAAARPALGQAAVWFTLILLGEGLFLSRREPPDESTGDNEHSHSH